MAMSHRLAFALPALLGALLASIPVTSRAAACSRQFMVFVQVLPICRLAAPSDHAVSGSTFDIHCTRNAGYSVSLTRGVGPSGSAYTINGVGSGARQVISLRQARSAVAASGPQNAAPLFLTINY